MGGEGCCQQQLTYSEAFFTRDFVPCKSDTLGTGSYGKVIKVVDVKNNRLLAVKLTRISDARGALQPDSMRRWGCAPKLAGAGVRNWLTRNCCPLAQLDRYQRDQRVQAAACGRGERRGTQERHPPGARARWAAALLLPCPGCAAGWPDIITPADDGWRPLPCCRRDKVDREQQGGARLRDHAAAGQVSGSRGSASLAACDDGRLTE